MAKHQWQSGWSLALSTKHQWLSLNSQSQLQTVRVIAGSLHKTPMTVFEQPITTTDSQGDRWLSPQNTNDCLWTANHNYRQSGWSLALSRAKNRPVGVETSQSKYWSTDYSKIYMTVLEQTCLNMLCRHCLLFCWYSGRLGQENGLLLRRSEVLRNLRHYLSAQSQGQHTIDCLEEKGVERGSVNHTNIGTVSKATLGKPMREGEEHIWPFPSAQIPPWTELNWVNEPDIPSTPRMHYRDSVLDPIYVMSPSLSLPLSLFISSLARTSC